MRPSKESRSTSAARDEAIFLIIPFLYYYYSSSAFTRACVRFGRLFHPFRDTLW